LDNDYNSFRVTMPARAAGRVSTARGRGAVASASSQASELAAAVLQDGGNAFDAAFALACALVIYHPQAGNLGGGGYLLFQEKASTPKVFSYREQAPRGATREALEIVIAACRSRGILLISDEVYRDLYFGMRPPSLRELGSYGVVLSSVSKGWGAPGLRVGWAVGDPAWLAPARTLHAFAVTAASAPAQRAALALLEASGEILPQGRREISARWQALAEAWKTHFGAELTPPDGTFYHWFPLPEAAHADPFAFCLRLRNEGKVILVPGTAFGNAGSAHARLSFAASCEQLAEGVRRLAPFWR